MPNPFKPTAGKMPPILIGRENVVTDFAEGLENGAGAPSRLMLVSGQRGYGKTVLLVELARVTLSYGAGDGAPNGLDRHVRANRRRKRN